MQVLEADDLAYVEKVRRATRRLGDRIGEDIQGALQDLRHAAHFDVEPPIVSARREVALVKSGVKRLSSWYMRYLSAQLDAFAATLVRLGETLSARTDRLEERSDQLEGGLEALAKRVARLERTEGRTPRPAATSRHGSTGKTTKPRRPHAS